MRLKFIGCELHDHTAHSTNTILSEKQRPLCCCHKSIEDPALPGMSKTIAQRVRKEKSSNGKSRPLLNGFLPRSDGAIYTNHRQLTNRRRQQDLPRVVFKRICLHDYDKFTNNKDRTLCFAYLHLFSNQSPWQSNKQHDDNSGGCRQPLLRDTSFFSVV